MPTTAVASPRQAPRQPIRIGPAVWVVAAIAALIAVVIAMGLWTITRPRDTYMVAQTLDGPAPLATPPAQSASRPTVAVATPAPLPAHGAKLTQAVPASATARPTPADRAARPTPAVRTKPAPPAPAAEEDGEETWDITTVPRWAQLTKAEERAQNPPNPPLPPTFPSHLTTVAAAPAVGAIDIMKVLKSGGRISAMSTRLHPLEMAFDGDPKTFWVALNDHSPLEIDLGEPKSIRGAVVSSAPDLQGTTVLEWQDKGGEWKEAGIGFFPATVTARHWRLTLRYEGQGGCLYELVFLGG